MASKKRAISFKVDWLNEYKWLAYSDIEKGGWCLPCVLFLSEEEKKHLGAFVRTPFTNYNKSKEGLTGHEQKKYHQECIKRLADAQSSLASPANRIDANLNRALQKTVEENMHILPSIVEAVIYCAKQQIALRGHRDDKINFNEPAVNNEGKQEKHLFSH